MIEYWAELNGAMLYYKYFECERDKRVEDMLTLALEIREKMKIVIEKE